MDEKELLARESIRDLVARYNANGDTGRFAEVLELFASDAVMDIEGRVYSGRDEILTIFTGVRDRPSNAPKYLRHWTGTHQIDVLDDSRARGRCYYQVLTSVGLDHWGRYIDEYRVEEGSWRFASRRVTVDGRTADSLFPAT
jgi:hypothetical protein